MLPDVAGQELVGALRELPEVPIIVVTATASEDDRNRVALFRLGADDYLVKPFSPRERAGVPPVGDCDWRGPAPVS